MRRFLCLFLCCLLLCSVSFSVEAAKEDSLGDLLEKFLYDNGLDSRNFALSYYNCDTEESYSFNPDTCFPAGTLWRFPLHMYFYEQEAMGAFDPPPQDPFKVFTIGEKTLEECRYQSIILGDEAISQKMLEYIGSYEQFKLTVNKAYGHIPEDLLEESFYTGNTFSARFWLNSLMTVSLRPERFGNMMRNYSIVQTADGIAAYDKSYPMVHIRGQEEGFIWDIGEVQGPQTYLLVCCVSEEAGGDEILAAVNSLICSYVESTAATTHNSSNNILRQDDSALDIVSGENNDKDTALLWVGIALGAALLLAGILGLIFWLFKRKNEDRYL